MSDDIVRVFRIIEYVGPRMWVEDAVRRSVSFRAFETNKYIQGVTLGTFPEILARASEGKDQRPCD